MNDGHSGSLLNPLLKTGDGGFELRALPPRSLEVVAGDVTEVKLWIAIVRLTKQVFDQTTDRKTLARDVAVAFQKEEG
jgi:hypothetical protein